MAAVPPLSPPLHPLNPTVTLINHRPLFFGLFYQLRPRGNFTCVRARSKLKELVLGNPSVMVEKGKYSYEVESLINKLSSLPPRGSIARCLDIFKNRLSQGDFAHVFKEFAIRGDWQRSLRLFKYMQRQMWCRPNDQVYTIVITLLGREGLLDKCVEIFDEMPSQGVPHSVFSYTALINSYGRHGRCSECLQLLQRMKGERIPPSILTYNSIINSCSRGGMEWENLLGLFAEMRHDGIQPDIATYNTLLSACSTRTLGPEAEMVFRTMIGGGVLPDTLTFRHLVSTYGKMDALEKVSELLNEMENSGNLPDVNSYNALMSAHARAGKAEESVGVLRQMQKAGCVPNSETYSILLNLYGREGKYDDVRLLFLEMKESNTKTDAATYNVLIDVFGEGGYLKEVVTLFDDMVEEGVSPNVTTYEGLVYACGKGGLHQDAKRILLHMTNNNVTPSAKAFTGVIEAYGASALYEEALVTFNTMNELGIDPEAETFLSLISMFCRGGMWREAEAMVGKMRELGLERGGEAGALMVEGYRQGGKFEEAVRTYVEMEVNETSLEAVLSVYCIAGLVDECEEHVREMREMGVDPSVMCCCMMASVYARAGRLEDARKVLDEMVGNEGSSVHQVIGQMMMGDFDDDSNWPIVEHFLSMVSSQGVGFGIRFYNPLIDALWWLGQQQRAVRLLQEAAKRGLLPELHRKSKLLWSVDVHRLWPGGACAAVSAWVNELQEMVNGGDEIPHIASVVVVRGRGERSACDQTPIAKAVTSVLEDDGSPTFGFSSWNNGRLTCLRSQLKRVSVEGRLGIRNSRLDKSPPRGLHMMAASI